MQRYTCSEAIYRLLMVWRFIARKTAKATSFHVPLFRGFCLRSVVAVSLRGISSITSISSAYEDVPNTTKSHIQHILSIGYVANSSILIYTAGEWFTVLLSLSVPACPDIAICPLSIRADYKHCMS